MLLLRQLYGNTRDSSNHQLSIVGRRGDFPVDYPSLSPPVLRVIHGSPTLTVYKFTEGDTTWWIPSFDLSLSILNEGARSGQVEDLRIIAEWKGYRESRKYEFYANYIVDYPSFHSDRKHRLQWERNAVIGEWKALWFQGHSEKHIHIVLEGPRWDTKQVGHIFCTLEIKEVVVRAMGLRRQEIWKPLAEYKFLITPQMFDDTSTCKPFKPKRRAINIRDSTKGVF